MAEQLSNDKQPKETSATRSAVGWRSRLIKWCRRAPARLINCLAYSLLAVAAIIVLFGLLTLLTGNAGSLNRSLDGNLNIFGSASYWSSPDQVTTFRIIQQFYAGSLVLMVACLAVLTAIVIVGLLNSLAFLGHGLVDGLSTVTGRPKRTVALMTVLIVWAAAIIIIWTLLNISSAIRYLLTACAMLLLDLGLMWLGWRLDAKVAANES